MRLSIVIPVYQVEQYVADCLSSVLDSSSTDYEVIIVNDGSKDASMDIVNSMASAHNCIRVINQQNQGLSAARMNGLEAAIGDFVWFIDSDDYVTPAATSEILDTICSNSDIDVFEVVFLCTDNVQIKSVARSSDCRHIDMPLAGQELTGY